MYSVQVKCMEIHVLKCGKIHHFARIEEETKRLTSLYATKTIASFYNIKSSETLEFIPEVAPPGLTTKCGAWPVSEWLVVPV